MRNIDEKFLETSKKRSDKYEPGTKSKKLITESRKVLVNLYDFIKGLKILELSSILISLNGWQNSKGKFSRKNFNTRDIVEVDLGLGHGYEMSYRHPCIVLHNSRDGFCFVVPCSTGKYGKKNKYIIDGEVSDGFERPTGVLIDAVRCVSKARITGKVGEIKVPFLDKMNTELLQLYFSRHHHRLTVMGKDLQKSQTQNQLLKQKISELEEKIKENVT